MQKEAKNLLKTLSCYIDEKKIKGNTIFNKCMTHYSALIKISEGLNASISKDKILDKIDCLKASCKNIKIIR